MPQRPPGDHEGTAAAVRAYLLDQTAALDDAERRWHDGDPEAVHDVRVACRRLRTVLRATRPLWPTRRQRRLVDRTSGALWGHRLRLSEARDEQVSADLDGGAPGAGPDPAVHPRLRADVDALVAATAGWPAIDESVDRVDRLIRRRLAQAARRTARRIERAQQADEEERGERLHRARKAAKTLRYLAEAAPDLPGATTAYDVAHRLQDLLGRRQDATLVDDPAALAAVDARVDVELPGLQAELAALHEVLEG